MHLNKLIVNDFPRKTTLEQELTKYRLLNIFYDRTAEIQFLENIIIRNPEHADKPKKWHKKTVKTIQKVPVQT